jgi:3'-5' exoribonuclease
MSAIATMEAGRPVEGVYAVRRKERRLSRQGHPYLSLTLADASGAIRAVLFDEPDFFAGRFAAGDRVRVTGQVVARPGRPPEVVVRHLRPAAEEVTAEDLLPRSHRDPDELFGFVLHLAGEVADPALRALVEALAGDESLAAAWRSAPCTRSGHHAYRGGLVEHTVGVAALCQTLAQWHPRLDADLLLAAALVHDVGHTRAFRLGATFELTEEGRLLGHLALGHEIVAGAAEPVGLPAERRLALLHAVAWHHGPPAGQPPGAASPEALALWRANALETGVKARLEGPGPVED